jgi:hypothetical protein
MEAKETTPVSVFKRWFVYTGVPPVKAILTPKVGAVPPLVFFTYTVNV